MTTSYNTVAYVYLREIFKVSSHPLTAFEIKETLKNMGLKTNMSTVYRRLKFMEQNQEINEYFINNKLFWEKKIQSNHAHFVCDICSKVKCLDLASNYIKESFESINYVSSILISGVCQEC
jgi:Fur family ferric uptake transcriptional regulator